MKLISSRWTYLYKRIFPVVIFTFLLIWFISAAAILISQGAYLVVIPIFLFASLFGFFAYSFIKILFLRVMDEVLDGENHLLVKNGGREEQLHLSNIINVGYTIMLNPPQIVLTLREPGAFGKDIAFMPPMSWNLWERHPIVDELIKRVDQARLSGMK